MAAPHGTTNLNFSQRLLHPYGVRNDTSLVSAFEADEVHDLQAGKTECCGKACFDIAEVKYFGSKSNDLGIQMTAFSVLNFITKEKVLAMVK